MNYRQIATAALFALTAAAFIYAAVWLFHLTEGAADLAIIIGRAAGVFAIIVWFFALLLIGFALLCLWAAVKVFWKLSPVARPPASPPSRTQREPTPKHRKAWIYAVAALLLVAAVPVLTFVSSFAHPDVQTLRSLDHKRYVSAAVWSPDGKYVATLSETFTRVAVWDVQSGTRIIEFTIPSNSCNCLLYTPDGKYILTPAAPREQRIAALVWDAATGQKVRDIPGPLPDQHVMDNSADRIALAPDGNALALGIGLSRAPFLALYSNPPWTTPTVLNLDGGYGYDDDPTALAFSPDAKRLAVASLGNRGPGKAGISVYVFDAATQELLWRKSILRDDAGAIESLTFSPDGKSLAVGARGIPRNKNSSSLAIVDATSGNVIHAFPQMTDRLWDLSWSADGEILATADGDDRTLRFYFLDQPQKDEKRVSVGAVMAVAFAPTGNRFVAAAGTAAVIGRVAEH